MFAMVDLDFDGEEQESVLVKGSLPRGHSLPMTFML